MRRAQAITLRLTTLGARFFLVFGLAAALTPQDLGQYGLVVAAVSLAALMIGFDLYTVTSRRLATIDAPVVAVIGEHLGLTTRMFVVALPVFSLLFIWSLLPWSLATLTLLLVYLEHLANELDRFLVVRKMQFEAGVAAFIRLAMSVGVTLGLLQMSELLRSVNTVLVVWIVFDVLGIGYASRQLLVKTEGNYEDFLRGLRSFSWRRAARNLRIAIPFLVGTVLLRGIFTLDRYYLQYFESLKSVGAYVVYYGLAMALTTFVSVAVHQYTYPRMLDYAHSGNARGVMHLFRLNLVQVFAVSSVYAFVLSLAWPQLASWIGKDAYRGYDGLLWTTLAAVVIYNLSLGPHYVLYAYRKDIAILLANAASFLVFVAVLGHGYKDPLTGLGQALICAFSVAFLAKTISVRKISSKGATLAT